jgi:hypothetical protein
MAEQGRAGQIPAASLEDPQAGQQISAVHGRDVARRQRIQRVGFVPVEKMSFIAFQAIQRGHRPGAAIQEIADGEIAEIRGRQRRGQPQSDIGRGGSLGDFHAQR